MVFFTFVGVMGFAAVTAIFKGLILKLLWGWFVVPIFGLPELSIAVAIGIGIIVSFLVRPPGKPEEESLKESLPHLAKSLSISIIGMALILFMGWIVHLFV